MPLKIVGGMGLMEDSFGLQVEILREQELMQVRGIAKKAISLGNEEKEA